MSAREALAAYLRKEYGALYDDRHVADSEFEREADGIAAALSASGYAIVPKHGAFRIKANGIRVVGEEVFFDAEHVGLTAIALHPAKEGK